MPASPPLTLTVPSDLALLPVVRTFIESVCRLGQLDQKTTDEMVLAANEAASNVIRHAHRGRTELPLQVQCVLLDDGIEVSLRDQGEPFDVTDVPFMDPAELRIGGRGVFLMRKLLDELSCCPRESGGNELRMVKRANSPAKNEML